MKSPIHKIKTPWHGHGGRKQSDVVMSFSLRWDVPLQHSWALAAVTLLTLACWEHSAQCTAICHRHKLQASLAAWTSKKGNLSSWYRRTKHWTTGTPCDSSISWLLAHQVHNSAKDHSSCNTNDQHTKDNASIRGNHIPYQRLGQGSFILLAVKFDGCYYYHIWFGRCCGVKVVSASFSICDFTLSARVRWFEKGKTTQVHTGSIIKCICTHSMPKLPILPHSITGCQKSYYSTQAGELRKRAHEISRISYIRDHRAHTKRNIVIIFTGTPRHAYQKVTVSQTTPHAIFFSQQGLARQCNLSKGWKIPIVTPNQGCCTRDATLAQKKSD